MLLKPSLHYSSAIGVNLFTNSMMSLYYFISFCIQIIFILPYNKSWGYVASLKSLAQKSQFREWLTEAHAANPKHV